MRVREDMAQGIDVLSVIFLCVCGFIIYVPTVARTDRIFTGTYSYVMPLRASATLTLRSKEIQQTVKRKEKHESAEKTASQCCRERQYCG